MRDRPSLGPGRWNAVSWGRGKDGGRTEQEAGPHWTAGISGVWPDVHTLLFTEFLRWPLGLNVIFLAWRRIRGGRRGSLPPSHGEMAGPLT